MGAPTAQAKTRDQAPKRVDAHNCSCHRNPQHETHCGERQSKCDLVHAGHAESDRQAGQRLRSSEVA
jgi:hypothetical protein